MIFQGARVVITGASAGLGAEYARQLHARGADLLLIARREERLAEIARTLNARRAGSVEFRVIDLSLHGEGAPNGLAGLCRELQSTRVDILINNAGRGSAGAFETISLEKELEMVRLNLMAPMATTHAVIPQMKARKSGALIFLSSVAGLQPLPFMATYAATKAFNFHHAMALRYELASSGIRVLTVCPGPTDTEFQAVAHSPDGSRDSAASVVRASLRALERDAASVITGLRSKALVLPTLMMPRAVATWLAGKVMRRALRCPVEKE